MEIIHLVLGKANPQRMNGVNKVVNDLATRQALAGEKVQLWGITANPVHDYPEREYQTRLYKTGKYPFLLDKELKSDIVKKKGTAIFHLHGGYIPAMYSAAIWMRRNTIPFVFTPHGSYNVIAREKNWLIKNIYFMLFELPLLKAAKAVHSLGKSEVAGLQKVYKNNKSVLIPYGFELPETVLKAEVKDQLIVGYCGRLDIYTKGLIELLEGFNAFNMKQPRSKLWIIGDGTGKEKLKALAEELELGHEIVFFGAKYGSEKDYLLNKCSVLAAPSRNEGLPTTVLEAASMGVPCLVTEATNTGDYIKKYNAGFVIAHTSADEIHHGLNVIYEELFEFKRANLMGNNARKMVAEAFNWKLILGRFQQLYQA